ncbi:uncharacterized protein J8A68_000043 [[Candida] subhashii]|uniref:Autophagy-related protein 33 n=1 Tax=[Candida] subhashii TaxID=561895 RepID=A0A8J5QXB2_9ASCO|nr:uncharacterized protein J8A68_000043 [[Candida] subhashii]KAG7666412.1 hypothetical protein J8A68_000043 [[Candida] subhashii]
MTAGTCVNTIKVLGFGSLGLLSSSLIYQALNKIPDLITKISTNSISTFHETSSKVYQFICNSRLINITLSVFSTGLFGLAYSYSPNSAKHPYLIYSAIGAPLSLICVYYQGLNHEKKILKTKSNKKVKKVKKPEQPPAQQVEEEVVAKVVSRDDDLGKSYVHLSDESGTSTPTSLQLSPEVTQTAAAAATHVEEEISIDEEVEETLVKKEFVQDLESIESGYRIGAIVSSAFVLLTSIGLIGDLYLL